jgi:hypothetical protein
VSQSLATCSSTLCSQPSILGILHSCPACTDIFQMMVNRKSLCEIFFPPHRFYNPSHFTEFWPLLPHCRNYLSLGHCECSSACMSVLWCHGIAVKSALVLTRMSPFSLLLFSVLGLVVCLSYSAWNCHKRKYVSSPSHQIIQGKKRNCLFTICDHILPLIIFSS